MPKRQSSKKQETEKVSTTIVYRKDSGLDYSKVLASCGAQAYKRSSVHVREDGSELRFDVAARDVTALMASVNSILRRLQVIEATKIR
jgi:tRNA threonylcarbamoyladenosine modification (KEOPS) complex  Pcc1 subunit